MAKVVMLVNSLFTGAKSGLKHRLNKGQSVDEEEVKHLVKGVDYDIPVKAEAKVEEGKKK